MCYYIDRSTVAYHHCSYDSYCPSESMYFYLNYDDNYPLVYMPRYIRGTF